jgi:hypothetical protein
VEGAVVKPLESALINKYFGDLLATKSIYFIYIFSGFIEISRFEGFCYWSLQFLVISKYYNFWKSGGARGKTPRIGLNKYFGDLLANKSIYFIYLFSGDFGGFYLLFPPVFGIFLYIYF